MKRWSGIGRAAPLALALGLIALAGPPARAGVLTGSWTTPAGGCQLVLEEYDGASFHLRRRPGAPGATAACTLTRQEFARGLASLLNDAFAARRTPGGAASLFLGTIAEIPGLSEELVRAAKASPQWDVRQGKARSGSPNGFVAQVLAGQTTLPGLFPRFTLAGVSVEKVLVPTGRMIRERRAGDGVPDARVPFDAMLWVRLRPRE
jgi:hypothetical protein